MKRLFEFLLTAFLLSGLIVAGAASAEGVAAIWTDKKDYAPEEIVTIFGSGFLPETSVNITVTRPDGQVEFQPDGQPGSWDVISNSSGAFDTTYQLDGIFGTYTVVATDGENEAWTTFTDANVKFKANGLPDGVFIEVAWSATKDGTTDSGVIDFTTPKEGSLGVKNNSTFTYSGFPSSVIAGGIAYNLDSALPASGFDTGAGTTTVTATYVAVVHNVNFATSGLPSGVSIAVSWNKTNPAGNPASGSTTFTSPGPSGDQGTKPSTTFTYGFPASVTVSGTTYNLSSTSPASGFTTGAAGGSTTVTATYVVANTPPTVNAGPDATINEGSTFSSSGFFTDPDPNTWTATVDYGDGSGNQALSLNPDKSFDLSHVYADNGNYTVKVAVTDDDGGVGTDTAIVTVNNVAPVVDAGADATIDEGDTFTSSGSFTDPGADTWTATVDYGDGSGPQPLTLNGKTFSLSHVYVDNGVYPVTVTVKDDDGGEGSDTVEVTVENVAPVVNAGSDATINEGATFSSPGSFTDPGADEWSATVDYGDGSGVQALTLTGKTFSLSHTYADDDVYTVTVTVDDGDGGVGTDTAMVTVNNVAPVVDAGADATINEGDTFTSSGSFTDPGADTWTATVDYGDGSGPQPLTLNGKTFSLSHVYADNGNHTVTVTVTDDDGGIDIDTATVTVYNVAPTVGNIKVMLNDTEDSAPVIVVNTEIKARADFTDPGVKDTHTATWYWGDGGSSAGTVDETNGSGTTNGAHTYTATGVYTIKVKVTDDDGDSGESEEFKYIVVYDPSAGFVTGGGWINSPAGAYVPDGSLTGKATFGFVSKYQKGAKIPTGNTEFQFHVAKMNFRSTVYEWLVIAGAKAQYKGTGTINGSGDYGFILTATDGQINGGGDVDKFRIKIVDKLNNTVYYDNQMGAAEDADPTTAIGGGSIVIHSDSSSKNSKTVAAAPALDRKFGFKALNAYPTPCNPEVWIPYTLGDGVNVSITIYSANGQMIRTLDLGYQNPGAYVSKEKSGYWDGRNEGGEQVSSGVYFYNIKAGDFTATRKFVVLQ